MTPAPARLARSGARAPGTAGGGSFAGPFIPHSAPWIVEEDREAVARTLEGGQIAAGALAADLEREVAARHGALGAVAAGSGTAALALALRGLGVGPGDEVVLPTYVCRAVLDAVAASGAAPVLCDVSEGWLMTPATVASRVGPRTRAVIVVHLFGIAADTAGILELGIPVVEDCCQAFGAPAPGGVVGRAGACAVFSFHATKCLTAGEGGAVASGDAALLARIRAARAARAVPAPLSDLQSALGLSQLRRYAAFLEARAAQAQEYFGALPDSLTAPLRALAARSMFFRFPLRLPAPDASAFERARRFFEARGIAVRRGVDALLHRELGFPDASFPGAVRCFDATLSIPLRPGLGPEARVRIIDGVREYLGA